MKACIIGWYGTETLGDRAILDGILLTLEQLGATQVRLGSLFPILTERTLFEDGAIYRSSFQKDSILMFDSRQKNELNEAVSKSDVVIMGGGPLMDLNELYIISYAFRKAKQLKKKTIIWGCGIGPLREERYQKQVKEIFSASDIIILRDELSKIFGQKYSLYPSGIKIHVLPDPAVISVLNFRENKNAGCGGEDYIAVNFRRFTCEYGQIKSSPDDYFKRIISSAAQTFSNVFLVPMHTFFIGGDDREYYTELLGDIHQRKMIQYKPLNLYELYELYSNARACIGMRYHSVVLQTLLNGNNFILDYTEKQSGKTSGFLSMFGLESAYAERYLNLQNAQTLTEPEKIAEILSYGKKTAFSAAKKQSIIDDYLKLLKEEIK